MKHLAIEMDEGDDASNRQVYNSFWANSPACTTTQGSRYYASNARWSKEAWEGRDDKDVKLVQEHVIPVKVQMDYIKKAVKENRPPAEVSRFLNAIPMAIVTKAQDENLNKAGYRSEMPKDWEPEEHGLWHRYDEVELDHSGYQTYGELSDTPAKVRKPKKPKAKVVNKDADTNADGTCASCGQPMPS